MIRDNIFLCTEKLMQSHLNLAHGTKKRKNKDKLKKTG